MTRHDDLNKAPDHYDDILPKDVNDYIKKRVKELEKDAEEAKKDASAFFKGLDKDDLTYLNSLL